jgi:outer membrane receptor protein involved in Fe transport
MTRNTMARRPAAQLRGGALAIGISSILFSWPGAAWAAPAAGVVEGIAKDSLERALSGAQLRLETSDGAVLGRTASDTHGHFAFSGIAPGTYALIGEDEGFDPATAIVTVAVGAGASADLTLPARAALNLDVVAKRLDDARLAIQPRIGASTYSMTDAAIENQPGGDNAPLNQVILRAPGVAQDSAANGDIHVRNEHANLQYRINGIILPEGVSGFGQALSPRFASSVDLITGALPAQYGLRTSGIIDIQTKSGAFTPGGSIGVYGGSNGKLENSADYGGSNGRLNYFVSGDYLQSGLGLEAPTGSYNALHDDTQQGHGFAYLDYVIDATSKVSAILGTYRGQFQIPNIPGQAPAFTVNGSADFNSANLDQTQTESSTYGVLSYLKSATNYDVQVSGFTRYSSLTYHPDPALGDLAFNGISQDAYRRSIASGIQTDASFKVTPDHTVRSGFTVTAERTIARTNSLVEAAGGPDKPFPLSDSSGKTGWTYGLYLQDEWHANSWLTINYGARFDLVDAYTHEDQISPRINAVIQATKTTTLHAGYARYFTPPPFELASNTNIAQFVGTTGEPPGVANGNGAVKAERADYFDIGISQQIIPGLKAGIDAYYKHSNNLIDEGQFGAPIILTAFNYRTARNIGVELTTTYDTGNFSFYGNLALAQQKAKGIDSGQFNFDAADLAIIATNAIHTDHDQLMTASAGASYLLHDTRFSIDILAGSGLRADGDVPNGHALPSYEQVNLGIGQKLDLPGAGKLTLRLDLVNVLDEVYVIRDGTGVGIGAPQFGPRRTIFAGIRKEF